MQSDRLTLGIGILVSYNNAHSKHLLSICCHTLIGKREMTFRLNKWTIFPCICSHSRTKVRSETRYDLMFFRTERYERISMGNCRSVWIRWQIGKRTVLDIYAGYQLYSKEQLK